MLSYKDLINVTIINLQDIQRRDTKSESQLNSLDFFDPNKELILENYTESQLDDIYMAMDQDHHNDKLHVMIDDLIAELQGKIQ